MPQVRGLPAFADNYIWLIEHGRRAAVVDPGDPRPALDALDAAGLELETLLITHHHPDHIGGVAEMRRRFPDIEVCGPADPRIPATRRVRDGDTVRCAGGVFQVLETPGHTRSHIAYYLPPNGDARGAVFCGDTLFACGCGRLFEGSPAQMHASLSALRALPDDTRVFCAHEYTLDNIEFALWVEPDSAPLRRRQGDAQAMRRAGRPTVPSTLALEKQTNPFLRFDQPEVVAAASRHAGRDLHPGVEVLAEVRRWKDEEFD